MSFNRMPLHPLLEISGPGGLVLFRFKSQVEILQCLCRSPGRYLQLVPPLDMASAGLAVWLADVLTLFLGFLSFILFDGFIV